jgi:hypothetical protein
MVGVRGLATVTPGSAEKTAKKKGAEQGKLDRVDRDGRNNPMLELVEERDEEEKEQEQESLAQPPGHGTGMRKLAGDAFRTDSKKNRIAPAYSDVDQGNLQDAWLLASCAAVAHADPELIVRRVQKKADGSFQVTLGEDTLRVTPEFSNERYADPAPNGQADTLWVALIEKAWALREAGSYENLEGGNPSRALEALTDRFCRRITLFETMELSALYRRMSDARKSRRAMVIRTRDSDVTSPLHPEHCYAVLDVIEKGKARLVRLYNPWGSKNNTRPIASMVLEVPLEALVKEAATLHLVTGGR